MDRSLHATFQASDRLEVITSLRANNSNGEYNGASRSDPGGVPREHVDASAEEHIAMPGPAPRTSSRKSAPQQSPMYAEIYENIKRNSSAKQRLSKEFSKQFKVSASLASTQEIDESYIVEEDDSLEAQKEESFQSLDLYREDDSGKKMELSHEEYMALCEKVALDKRNISDSFFIDFTPLIPRINFMYRDLNKELGFLNYLAITRRDLIMLGYALQIIMSFVGLGLFGIVQVAIPNRARVCNDMVDQLAAQVKNEQKIEQAEVMQSLKTITCNMIVEDVSLDDTSFGKVMRQGAILFAGLTAFILLVWLLQMYIYKSKRIKNKAWVLLVVNVQYACQMWLSPIAVYIMQQNYWCDCEKGQKFWPLNVFLFYNFALFFATWFAGLTTLQLLLNSVIGLTIYYYFTIEALAMERESSEPLSYWISSSVLEHTISFNVILALLMLICAYINESNSRYSFVNRITMHLQAEKIDRQRQRNDRLQNALMESILPQFVVQAVKRGQLSLSTMAGNLSQKHEGVSILFADIVGFSSFAKQVDSILVMAYLNDLFEHFDGVTDSYNVYKIETVGDCYVCAVGVVTGRQLKTDASATYRQFTLRGQGRSSEHYPSNPASPTSNSGSRYDFSDSSADSIKPLLKEKSFGAQKIQMASEANTRSMIGFAKAILNLSHKINKPQLNIPTQLRVGMNTGPCMSGIIGTKSMRFCLFGDTMNTAARMEQNGIPDRIHATETVYDLVPEEKWEGPRAIDVKNIGRMNTYLLSVE